MLSSDHLPILIRLQMKTTKSLGLSRTYVNLKNAKWDRYRQEVEAALSKRSLPTDSQRDEKIFRSTQSRRPEDQKTDVTKLWRTIKGIDGRSYCEAEKEAITFNGISFSSSKQIAARFSQQFNTSKLGRHTSSSESRLVTRETKRKSLEMAHTFTMHGSSEESNQEL